VICETKCIWSHYLLLDRERSLPDLALSLRTRAGPLQPIDATMQLCRTDYPAPWDWPAALTIADAWAGFELTSFRLAEVDLAAPRLLGKESSPCIVSASIQPLTPCPLRGPAFQECPPTSRGSPAAFLWV
jgi:hypothetical protein